MPPDQPRPPLWRDVDNAWWAHVDTEPLVCPPSNDQAASVIRAVADYLEALWAAQSPAPEIDDKDAPGFFAGMNVAQEIHREGTLNILRGEALKAEEGQ